MVLFCLKATRRLTDIVSSTRKKEKTWIQIPWTYKKKTYPILTSDIELGLSNQDLVQISTKDLNKLMKKKGIGKDRAKHIKQERRTLKNEAYAASLRVKRETEEYAIPWWVKVSHCHT